MAMILRKTTTSPKTIISLEEQEEDQEECSRGQIALLQLMFFAAASRPQTKQDLFIVF